MLLSRLKNQKGTRKILVDLLYKKGYCLCIPDPKLIKSQFEQVRPIWIQKLLLSKNTLELSVIPMFMLIFIKNKSLTADQSERLLALLQILISQAEFDTIDQIFFDNNIKQMAWSYYILNELLKFTLTDFTRSEVTSKRIMAMAAGIEFFLGKTSMLTMTKFCLNTENSGFNVIQKLFYAIAYENLHSNQIIYLSHISQKIISKTTDSGIETLSFQMHHNGFSFIWYALGTWLQLIFQHENSNQIKIKLYTELINSLFEKISNEKISFIFLENENKGCILILRYIFFSRLQLDIFHPRLVKFYQYFDLWCKRILSALTFHQIELLLKTVLTILNNDLTLSIPDRWQLLRVFFDFLLDCCQLKIQEVAILKDLKVQFEDQFFPSNRLMKLFRQVRAYCNFFSSTNFRNSINKEDEIPHESSDLLSSEYARLTTNYSALR